jgi:chemotaxis protein MotB
MTLLFAFFVVMYALSTQDLARARLAAQSIRAAFGGPPIAVGGPGGAQVNPFRATGDCAPCDKSASETSEEAETRAELSSMRSEIDADAQLEAGHADLGQSMETLVDRRGLVIRVAAKDFFAKGEASVREDLRPLLDRIGRVVARSRRPVRIEGHADTSEIKSPGFASSWDLSAARATWVARYWITRFELDPRQVGIAGYAHYRPSSEGESPDAGAEKSRAHPTSEWAHAMNRRIEIVVER